MIDFRYHALTIAAIFFALATGLVVGATIGDSGVIEKARGGLESSLRADARRARDDERVVRTELDRERRFLRLGYPVFVANSLFGDTIAVIGSDSATRPVLDDVVAATQPAGARIVYAAELREAIDFSELAVAVGIAPPGSGASDRRTAVRLGRAVGRRIATGDLRAVRSVVFRRLSGRMGRVDAVVFAHAEPDIAGESVIEASKDEFERAVIAALLGARRTVVGVERSDLEPSSIGWYRKSHVSTVDNIESYSGRYSLVELLAGAEGDYGVRSTADALIPVVSR